MKQLETNSYDSSNIENDDVPDSEEKHIQNVEHEKRDENDNVHVNDETAQTNPAFLSNDRQSRSNTPSHDALTVPNVESNDMENKSIEDPTFTISHNEFDISDNYDSIPDENFIDENKLKNNINLNDKTTKIIDEGNIEKIGNFIIEGHGECLINRRSHDSQIQEFINNLPIYLVS